MTLRVAIAGATGLIGHGIAAALAREGHRVVAVGRGAAADVRFDLAAPQAAALTALAGCDALVHAAGVTDEDFADPARAEAKTEGARVLAAAARDAGIRRMAYVSSAHVYGPLEGRIDESRPPDPRSAYARAHLAAEALFREASPAGGAVLLARPCAAYGLPPSLDRFARWSLIPFDFPRQALSGRIVLKSHGEQRRNFVPAEGVGNLVAWWLAAGREGVTIANAPGRDEMSVYDFAWLCATIAGAVTGRPCEVVRPADLPPAAAPLEYRTRVAGHLPGPSLEQHVLSLLHALTQEHAS